MQKVTIITICIIILCLNSVYSICSADYLFAVGIYLIKFSTKFCFFFATR